MHLFKNFYCFSAGLHLIFINVLMLNPCTLLAAKYKMFIHIQICSDSSGKKNKKSIKFNIILKAQTLQTPFTNHMYVDSMRNCFYWTNLCRVVIYFRKPAHDAERTHPPAFTSTARQIEQRGLWL